MFNVTNKILVYVTVGAVMSLIMMGGWLNVTINQKAILKQAVATQEHTITTLREDIVDKEYAILSNQKTKESISDDLEEATNKLKRLKNESTNNCITEPIPSDILKLLHKRGSKDRVYIPATKLVIPYQD